MVVEIGGHRGKKRPAFPGLLEFKFRNTIGVNAWGKQSDSEYLQKRKSV